MPRKIRQLIAELETAGFTRVPGGKGSHRKYRHPKYAGSVVLSGQDGDDAHHYQEKQVRNAIRETSR
ncbi:MAG TPA: type II toxin-antitoxin system HicA family toxin [Verrucomicrobiae bacterium]|nr:type II toxin-antitoxin system HicA family toxin [Verrucomicrobiae bacterium]